MKQNGKVTEGGSKLWPNFSVFVDHSSRNFEIKLETLTSFERISGLFIRCFIPEIGGLLGPQLLGEGIFKSHSLPDMWEVLVEFRSVNSEVSWQKKNIQGVRPTPTTSCGLEHE